MKYDFNKFLKQHKFMIICCVLLFLVVSIIVTTTRRKTFWETFQQYPSDYYKSDPRDPEQGRAETLDRLVNNGLPATARESDTSIPARDGPISNATVAKCNPTMNKPGCTDCEAQNPGADDIYVSSQQYSEVVNLESRFNNNNAPFFPANSYKPTKVTLPKLNPSVTINSYVKQDGMISYMQLKFSPAPTQTISSINFIYRTTQPALLLIPLPWKIMWAMGNSTTRTTAKANLLKGMYVLDQSKIDTDLDIYIKKAHEALEEGDYMAMIPVQSPLISANWFTAHGATASWGVTEWTTYQPTADDRWLVVVKRRNDDRMFELAQLAIGNATATSPAYKLSKSLDFDTNVAQLLNAKLVYTKDVAGDQYYFSNQSTAAFLDRIKMGQEGGQLPLRESVTLVPKSIATASMERSREASFWLGVYSPIGENNAVKRLLTNTNIPETNVNVLGEQLIPISTGLEMSMPNTNTRPYNYCVASGKTTDFKGWAFITIPEKITKIKLAVRSYGNMVLYDKLFETVLINRSGDSTRNTAWKTGSGLIAEKAEEITVTPGKGLLLSWKYTMPSTIETGTYGFQILWKKGESAIATDATYAVIPSTNVSAPFFYGLTAQSSPGEGLTVGEVFLSKGMVTSSRPTEGTPGDANVYIKPNVYWYIEPVNANANEKYGVLMGESNMKYFIRVNPEHADQKTPYMSVNPRRVDGVDLSASPLGTRSAWIIVKESGTDDVTIRSAYTGKYLTPVITQDGTTGVPYLLQTQVTLTEQKYVWMVGTLGIRPTCQQST